MDLRYETYVIRRMPDRPTDPYRPTAKFVGDKPSEDLETAWFSRG